MGSKEIKKNFIKKNEKTYQNELYIENEMILEGSGQIINLNNVNIIGKSTCLIKYTEDNLNKKGTGFFIELPILNSNKPMKGLMTNNHILNHKNLKKKGFSINFEIQDTLFTLNPKNHFTFSDPFLDVTFIKLEEEEIDNLGIDCLEIHEEEFIQKDVFIVHYPNGKNLSFSQGKIKNIWGYNLLHTVSTDRGSSGSPLVLSSDNKIIGIHKSAIKEKQCNAATNIQTIVQALRIIYNSQITNMLSIIKKARTPLTDQEINELKEHGLIKTDSPYIFISPPSKNITPLWFYRTNHAWYWTPTEPENYDYYISNWLIIYPSGSLKVIGGKWNGIEPAERNIILIHWLESTGLKYLI